MIKAILKWTFCRCFGILDTVKFIKLMRSRKLARRARNDYWGDLTVDDDRQLGEWKVYGLDEYPINWYSVRLFSGTEQKPGKTPEYWVGIRWTMITPYIPVPVCLDEKVYKIGKNQDTFWDAYNTYHRYSALMEHEEKYVHKIIDEATIKFVKSDVMYKNDNVFANYD